jgi:S-DNA-T family DNA segregation ATPase FtsK/SpoIIIE
MEDVTEEPSEGFDSPFIPGPSGDSGESDASLYDKAVDVVLRDRRVSTSYIQRRLRIGYNRAASLIEEMEDQSVISAPNHAGKREILVPPRDDEG